MHLRSAILAISLLTLFVTGAFCQDVGVQPVPPTAAHPQRVRMGGNVVATALIHKVDPVYPSDIHVSGTVVLHAIIAKDGTVQELTYISGPDALVKAVTDAVKQWRYKPMLLNGEPVEVDTTVSVLFNAGDTPPTAAQSTRITVEKNVQAGKLVHPVVPVYPRDAIAARISGTVLFHAVIGKDGKVLELTVVSGPPELQKAAAAAVKKWRYKPTKLNGEPVEVYTDIAVVFTIGR